MENFRPDHLEQLRLVAEAEERQEEAACQPRRPEEIERIANQLGHSHDVVDPDAVLTDEQLARLKAVAETEEARRLRISQILQVKHTEAYASVHPRDGGAEGISGSISSDPNQMIEPRISATYHGPEAGD